MRSLCRKPFSVSDLGHYDRDGHHQLYKHSSLAEQECGLAAPDRPGHTTGFLLCQGAVTRLVNVWPLTLVVIREDEFSQSQSHSSNAS